MNYLLVGLGGFVGSILRYAISVQIQRREISIYGLPLHTLLVNILGSLLIGMLFAYFQRRDALTGAVYMSLTVGICGGFTTFSTFSLELLNMIKNSNFITALSYIMISVLLSIGAVYMGYELVSRILTK